MPPRGSSLTGCGNARLPGAQHRRLALRQVGENPCRTVPVGGRRECARQVGEVDDDQEPLVPERPLEGEDRRVLDVETREAPNNGSIAR